MTPNLPERQNRNSLVSNPEKNPFSTISDYATTHEEVVLQNLQDNLTRHKITPQEYRRVIDLASGNGGIAYFLTEKIAGEKWNKEAILCIDKNEPNPPIVEGLRWQYINLSKMAFELFKEKSIKKGLSSPEDDLDRLPPELFPLQGQFDLITCYHAFFLGKSDLMELAEFFLRPGGKIVTESGVHMREEFIELPQKI